MGGVGQTSPDLDYRGRGLAEDGEGANPCLYLQGRECMITPTWLCRMGEELGKSVEVAAGQVAAW